MVVIYLVVSLFCIPKKKNTQQKSTSSAVHSCQTGYTMRTTGTDRCWYVLGAASQPINIARALSSCINADVELDAFAIDKIYVRWAVIRVANKHGAPV